MKRIAFVSCAEFPTLCDDDWAALPALNGLETVVWDWQKPAPPGIDLAVIRSCWNYHLHLEAFERWLGELTVPVVNPIPMIRWNLRKTYLQRLQAGGAYIPPTLWLGRGDTLRSAMRQLGTAVGVLKPVVSLSAWRTCRVTAETPTDASLEGMMLQAYLPEIEQEGELSLVFFGGAYSHAVVKRPRPGDFRVQMDFGGTREWWPAPPEVVAEAQRVLSLAEADCGASSTYARVDFVRSGGRCLLMELELIDPVLHFEVDQRAAGRFAAVIREKIRK